MYWICRLQMPTHISNWTHNKTQSEYRRKWTDLEFSIFTTENILVDSQDHRDSSHDSSTIRLWPSILTKMTVWLDSKQSTFGSTVHYASRTTVCYKTDKGSLFLLILMWWAFISFCNSRCPWSRSQGGLSSNNRIAPSELKEHSDSPPDYDTVLGICSNPIIDSKQPNPYPITTKIQLKARWFGPNWPNQP